MIPADHRPRDARPLIVQPNSLNEQGDNNCCALYQHQINLSKVVTSHITLRVSASQLVKPKWVKLLINRTIIRANEVREKFNREHKHCYFPKPKNEYLT